MLLDLFLFFNLFGKVELAMLYVVSRQGGRGAGAEIVINWIGIGLWAGHLA